MSDAAEKLSFLLGLQESLGGSIPVDRWMREALYHEKYGYYTTQIREVGRAGDFTTWPAREDNLAKAIVAWLKPLRCGHLIEVGAGSGQLPQGILRSLGWWGRPQYHIVEASPILQAQQQKRLGGKVKWSSSLTDALALAGGEAVIISNELVDAFPCRIFQWRSTGWQELSLRIESGKVLEIWTTADLPDSSVAQSEWADGQRVEIHESYRQWQEEHLAAWTKGAMLTIDYGDTSPRLYHRRPRGTLRAYSHHQRLEGSEAFGAFGRRDLTADVNFSDLIRWRPECVHELMTLGAFLEKYHRPVAGQLLAAGEAFQVLIQAR